MHNQLSLRFQDDSDGTGELFAVVRQGEFRGSGSAWFGVEELKAFGHALQEQFPLRGDSPITLEGGFWTRSSAATIEQLHLGLSVYPIGDTGTVGIKVTLATKVHANERSASQCSVTVELQTNYEPLRTFGRGIVAIVSSAEEQVTLLTNDASQETQSK